MSNFTEKPLFTLKQLIGAIAIALTIGGGIARFESKSNIINEKLDNITVMVTEYKKGTDSRLIEINQLLAIHTNEIRAINTALSSMLRPDEPVITKRR